MKNAILIALTAVLSFTGCKMTEQLDDMHAKTIQMSENVQSTDDGAKIMYLQIRSKEARDTRDKEMKNLQSGDLSFEQMVTSASVYVMSMEYQLWINDPKKGEDQAKRERFMLRSAEEFFRDVKALMGRIRPHKMSPTKDKNTYMALYALSVALHKKHDFQLDLIEKEGVAPVSMLDMIKSTLVKAKQVDSGELPFSALKEYEEEIMHNSDIAVFLLEARYNMLPAMVLANISSLKKNYSFLTLGVPGLVNKIKHLFFDWESDYTKFEWGRVAKQHVLNTWLDEALDTRAYLKSIGVEAKLDSKVRKIYSNMRIEANCELCTSDMIDQVDHFLDKIDELLHR